MNEIEKVVYDLSRKGYCCSQIMVKLGLDARESENQELLDAVSGLCSGLHAGLTCGTLTGGACLLAMFDKEAAAREMIPHLVDWFTETFSGCYGGSTCREIIAGNPMNKMERCPGIIAQTFEKCRELLEDRGYEV